MAKRDAAKAARWRRFVSEQEASGLSIRQFCKQHALHESAFYFWRRHLANTPTFVPANVIEPPAAAIIEIILADQTTLRVPTDIDPTTLQRIVKAVRPC